MPSRIEITLKPEMLDAEGEGLSRKARDYFGLEVESVRTVHIVTIDAALTEAQCDLVRSDVFTNPVTLLNDIMFNLFHPDLFLRAVVTTGMLTAVFIVAYVILFLLPRISLEPVHK